MIKITYPATFKVKIAMEAIKGKRTINEIASHNRTVPKAIAYLKRYFQFYNAARLHHLLDYRTPLVIYQTLRKIACAASAVKGPRTPLAPLTAYSLRLWIK